MFSFVYVIFCSFIKCVCDFLQFYQLCMHFQLLQLFSCFATPWTVACQAPLSVGFSRQEYWSAWPCPPPGDLSNSGVEPTSPAAPALQVDSYCWATGETPLSSVALNNHHHNWDTVLFHHQKDPLTSANHLICLHYCFVISRCYMSEIIQYVIFEIGVLKIQHSSLEIHPSCYMWYNPWSSVSLYSLCTSLVLYCVNSSCLCLLDFQLHLNSKSVLCSASVLPSCTVGWKGKIGLVIGLILNCFSFQGSLPYIAW